MSSLICELTLYVLILDLLFWSVTGFEKY